MDDRKEAIEVLTRARDLISDPERWVQRQMRLEDSNTGYVAYCATGAMGAVMRGHNFLASFLAGNALQHASEKILDRVPPGFTACPIVLNDSTDHETVMLMFKHAIAELEGRP